MASSLRADAPVFLPLALEKATPLTNIQRQSRKKRNKALRNIRRKHSSNAPQATQTKQENESFGKEKVPAKGRRRRGRRKESGRKNRHGLTKNAEAEQNVEPAEIMFPPLKEGSLLHQSQQHQVDVPNQWSKVAWDAHAAQVEKFELEERKTLEEKDTTKLVVLESSRSKPTTQCEPNESSQETRHRVVLETEGRTGPLFSTNLAEKIQNYEPVAPRLDMVKLRNRWWRLVQEKRKTQEQDRDESHESESSSILSDNSTDSSTAFDAGDYSVSTSSDNSDISIFYEETAYPLHHAIIEDNVRGLDSLLKNHLERRTKAKLSQLGIDENDSLLTTDEFSPLDLAVYLDKPQMVKRLLESSSFSKTSDDMTALFLASELGLDGCIKILQSHRYFSTSSARDPMSHNIALHYACHAGAPPSTLRLLLGRNHHRLLLAKNSFGQTPLHVACEFGHDALVDACLKQGGTSIVGKVLNAKDGMGQTPLLTAIANGHASIVTSLLMWRGNHHNKKKQYWQKPTERQKNLEQAADPLAWAVSKGCSMQMVQILLEFHEGYNLDESLCEAVVCNNESRPDVVCALVAAGADPCCFKGHDTALSLTACRDSHLLIVMLDEFDSVMELSQRSRRQDVKLARQPESYFETIEANERHRMNVAMTDALVKALYKGYSANSNTCLESSLVLWKHGAKLHDTAYNRLRKSLTDHRLVPSDISVSTVRLQYESSAIHYAQPGSDHKITAYCRTGTNYWSNVLCCMPWMANVTKASCGYLQDQRFKKLQHHAHAEGDVVLVTEGGHEFVVHGEIMSLKSGKLAAAIRFARMNESNDNVLNPVRVQLQIPDLMCKWLIQHCYHGSIASGWSSNQKLVCRQLLQLSLLAEEFLCPSLERECEMRLLSSDPFRCFCWSCCQEVTMIKNDCTREWANMPAIKCVYRARGPSSLLNANNVLDTLAVSQHLGDATVRGDDSKIKCSVLDPSMAASGSGKHGSALRTEKTRMPFESVREQCLMVMLQDFGSVLTSESFESSLDDTPGDSWKDKKSKAIGVHAGTDGNEHQILLLRLCLEELASSCAGSGT